MALDEKTEKQLNIDASQNYLRMSIGDIGILAEHSSITSIESVQDIDSNNALHNSIGWLYCDSIKVPVYSINEQLEIECERPIDKMFCAVMHNNESYISITCSDVSTFKQQAYKLNDLPDNMRVPSCPIDSLCTYSFENRRIIDYVTSADTLVKHYIDEFG